MVAWWVPAGHRPDRLGRDVGLLEASPAGELPAVFDQRNLSFAAATVNALTALG